MSNTATRVINQDSWTWTLLTTVSGRRYKTACRQRMIVRLRRRISPTHYVQNSKSHETGTIQRVGLDPTLVEDSRG